VKLLTNIPKNFSELKKESQYMVDILLERV